MSRLLVWITVVSCGGVSLVPTGSATREAPLVRPGSVVGPAGPDGNPGPSAGYNWVDSTGLAVTSGMPLLWIDPDTGWVWAVDAETGLVETEEPTELRLYYTDAGCTAGERVFAQRPDTPFRHDGSGGWLVARGANQRSDPTCATSYQLSGICTAIACRSGPWILTHDLVATGIASPPPSPWVGPLHLER